MPENSRIYVVSRREIPNFLLLEYKDSELILKLKRLESATFSDWHPFYYLSQKRPFLGRFNKSSILPFKAWFSCIKTRPKIYVLKLLPSTDF